MMVVCQHCGKKLKEYNDGNDAVSHGDCMGYPIEPCEASKEYMRQAKLDIQNWKKKKNEKRS